MPKKIDPALKDRAVRLVRDHRADYPSTARAIAAVASQEGIGRESLRRWVAQADIDAAPPHFQHARLSDRIVVQAAMTGRHAMGSVKIDLFRRQEYRMGAMQVMGQNTQILKIFRRAFSEFF